MQMVPLWKKERTQPFYRYVLPTPLYPYNSTQIPWKELWLKDETKQVTNAFKFRGTCYRLLSEDVADKVVTTASTGGHGMGLAAAARIHGIQARIFVPARIAQVKLGAIAAAGAIISQVEGDYEQAKRAAQAFAQEAGAIYIPGFDDHDIITGNSSLFAEIEGQYAQGFDVLFVPVGGGGLLAACIQKYRQKKVKIVGVELASAPAMTQSLVQGERVILERVTGRAEGLLIPQVGAIPFQIAQQAANLEMFLVTDDQISHAMRLLWQCNGIRAEGAGAAALAAALRYSQADRGQKAVAIVSGGNIDDADFQEALASPDPQDLV